MEEQCCIILEDGTQCPEKAVWVTWDLLLSYEDTYNYYCEKHLTWGLSTNGPSEVCPAESFEP